MDTQPIFIAPGDGRTIRNPAGGMLTFMAGSEETGGAVTMWESTAAPGEGPPLHLHVSEDEILYMVDGDFRVRLEDDLHEAPAGSFVFVPKGVPHTWQNAGDTPARLAFVFIPGAPGMERFFERAAELPDESRLAEAFGSFAADAGMEVLGPPLAVTHPAGR